MAPSISNGHILKASLIGNEPNITRLNATFLSVIQAWSQLSTTIRFPEDADHFSLRLTLEQVRLQTWSKAAGLDKTQSDARILAVSELIIDSLLKLKRLFTETDTLQARYGIVSDTSSGRRWRGFGASGDVAAKEPKAIEKVMLSVRSNPPHRQISSQAAPSVDTESLQDGMSVRSSLTKRFSSTKKARWIFKDAAAFNTFLIAIAAQLRQLEALLSESQARILVEGQMRTSVQLLSNIENRSDLALVQKAIAVGEHDSTLCQMLERKAISDALAFSDFSENGMKSEKSKSRALISLNIDDFFLPEGTPAIRLLTSSKTWRGAVVLLERKSYPPDTDPADVEKYEARMRRLTLLLSNHSSNLNTLRAIGYFADPSQSCWWLAYDFPLRQKQIGATQVPTRLTFSTRPISLHCMLTNRATQWKPAMDDRVRLAGKLASTLCTLFTSGWLHKSLRSANVLFPYMYSQKAKQAELDPIEDISKPMLAGFEYSRPDNESWKGIIYRPPQYHPSPSFPSSPSSSPENGGRAIPAPSHIPAGPYRIQYDMYAFGLMLVEIALWMPLHDFLDAHADSFADDDDGQNIVNGTATFKTAHADDNGDGGVSLSSPATITATIPRVVSPSTSTSAAADSPPRADDFSARDARELQRRVQRNVRGSMAYLMGRSYRDAVRWCLGCVDAAVSAADATDTPDDAAVAVLDFYGKVVVPLERLVKNASG